MKRRHFLAFAAAASQGSWAQSGGADAFPSRPVKIIVPFVAGSSSDISARRVGEAMGKTLGQSFVIENVPGGGGIIGVQRLMRQPADGYTLLAGTIGTHGINSGIYKSLPYDPLKDFAGISRITSFPNVLVVHPSLNVRTLKDLIGLVQAKAKSGTPLTYASGGNGTTSHLGGAQLKLASGADLLHVPYTSAAAALPDLLAGRVAIMFGNMPVVQPHIEKGSLVAIATTGTKRMSVMPDLKTVREQGHESIELTAWIGLFAPAGTPQPILEKLNQSVRTATQSREVEEALGALGTSADSDPSPTAFNAFVQSEVTKWVGVAKAGKVSVD